MKQLLTCLPVVFFHLIWSSSDLFSVREVFTIKIDGAEDQPNVGDSVNFVCSVPGGSNYGNPIWLDALGELILDIEEGLNHSQVFLISCFLIIFILVEKKYYNIVKLFNQIAGVTFSVRDFVSFIN